MAAPRGGASAAPVGSAGADASASSPPWPSAESPPSRVSSAGARAYRAAPWRVSSRGVVRASVGSEPHLAGLCPCLGGTPLGLPVLAGLRDLLSPSSGLGGAVARRRPHLRCRSPRVEAVSRSGGPCVRGLWAAPRRPLSLSRGHPSRAARSRRLAGPPVAFVRSRRSGRSTPPAPTVPVPSCGDRLPFRWFGCAACRLVFVAGRLSRAVRVRRPVRVSRSCCCCERGRALRSAAPLVAPTCSIPSFTVTVVTPVGCPAHATHTLDAPPFTGLCVRALARSFTLTILSP